MPTIYVEKDIHLEIRKLSLETGKSMFECADEKLREALNLKKVKPVKKTDAKN